MNEAVLLEEHEDAFAGDDPLSTRDVVEEGKGMEIGAGCQCLSIGLQGVLLSL